MKASKSPASNSSAESRRSFLKKSAAATLGIAAASPLLPVYGAEKNRMACLVADLNDALIKQPPVQWALGELRTALEARGLAVQSLSRLVEAPAGSECIVVSGHRSELARAVLVKARVSISDMPEALGVVRGKASGREVLLACGSDARGLVYALLEVADRVRLAPEPLAELRRPIHCAQQPANRIRSIARLFASDVEDKGWYNDRAFWPRYLTELATQRFNRFALTLGLGYDFTTDIRDACFHFAYPFLVAVPGYKVRAAPLPDAERERNLEMLRFISEETVRRGLHFQLGLWTHAYEWVNSPRANYVIEGLSRETHAAYCRAALAALLEACPAIGGLTFRVHGESGIAEGSYEFWKTVFEGVAHCGRKVEIDMHAKGIDDRMIDLALATGMPVNVSPKYWAEHMGLGYMQGAIRPLEMPPREERDSGFFSKSNGSRRFLRYGYGDLLREDRRYGVLHRVWPGTQRLLLWGSPDLAADYGRASSFCGSAGVEWCEPLSFKGRKGSGLPGGRTACADKSLEPALGDFEKYLYTYRLLGRHAYDPDCAPEEWQRLLRKDFGRAALPVETALREASQILPLITTAHCPSAANNNYWPEMYTNMAIVDAKRPHPYGDTMSPKRFGAVSSLDPEFFSRVDDFAADLMAGEPRLGAPASLPAGSARQQLAGRDAGAPSGEPDARYSPAWVAATLQAAAEAAEQALSKAKAKVQDPRSPEFRRLAADVTIECGLGRFFAWKFRAAVLYALYERSQYRPALEQTLAAYRRARTAWAELAEAARPIYRGDVTFGPGKFQRGHWLDRLPAIDEDIADMERLLQRDAHAALPEAKERSLKKAIQAVLDATPDRRRANLREFHQPANTFRRGEPLVIEASLAHSGIASSIKSVRLRFRHVNQGETWQTQEMAVQGKTCRATIPAAYTDSPFPLQYHFEVREDAGGARLLPGIEQRWRGQPYFYVRQDGHSE